MVTKMGELLDRKILRTLSLHCSFGENIRAMRLLIVARFSGSDGVIVGVTGTLENGLIVPCIELRGVE